MIRGDGGERERESLFAMFTPHSLRAINVAEASFLCTGLRRANNGHCRHVEAIPAIKSSHKARLLYCFNKCKAWSSKLRGSKRNRNQEVCQSP